MIDGVDAPSVTGGHSLEVFVLNRLNSRHVLHSNLLILSELQHLVVRARLDIKFLLEDVHFALDIRRELGIGHVRDRVVVRDLMRRAHACAERNRFGTQNSAVEVVIALREVGENDLHLVHLLVHDFYLRREVAVVLHERSFPRRREEIEEGVEENHTQTYTADDITA